MTDWQWQVILALIRIVLKVESRTNDDNDEWFDLQIAKDRATLESALTRTQP